MSIDWDVEGWKVGRWHGARREDEDEVDIVGEQRRKSLMAGAEG